VRGRYGAAPATSAAATRRVSRRITGACDARTADDHVREQIEGSAATDEITHQGRRDVAGQPREPGRQRQPPSSEEQGERHNDDDCGQRSQLHHRLERDAEAVRQVVHEVEKVDLESARRAHARDRGTGTEDRPSEREPEQISRVTLACAQVRM